MHVSCLLSRSLEQLRVGFADLDPTPHPAPLPTISPRTTNSTPCHGRDSSRRAVLPAWAWTVIDGMDRS
jgi:hypothetical protein